MRKSISLIQAIILLEGKWAKRSSTSKNQDIDPFSPTPQNIAMAKTLVDQIWSRTLSTSTLKMKAPSIAEEGDLS
jgi:hypothetical protein